jgi:hypothetical protein
MGRLLVAVKRVLAGLPLGLGIIEFCKVCGQRQPISWWADDALWQEVVGDRYGVLCPGCFEKAAAAKGILLHWVPSVVWRKEWGVPAPVEGEEHG